MLLELLRYGSLALIAGSIMTTVYTLGANRPTEAPELGRRGLKRSRALEENALLAIFDPWIRLAASWFAFIPLVSWKAKIDQRIGYAGDWLGLTPDEVLGMCLLTFVGGTAFGLALTGKVGLPSEFALFFGVVASTMPLSRLKTNMFERFKIVGRTLPGAIDLAAMCMAAGLDFPGSLRQIVQKTPIKNAPLREEFEYILQELELGKTRRQALENFAMRVPSEPVKDFVGAVVQSEEKGNPLANILRIQANMLRMRRSVMAEEAATRAGIKMLFPLMCIFIAIIIMLVGPSMLALMESGL